MKIKIIYDNKGNQIIINAETGKKVGEVLPMGDLSKSVVNKNKQNLNDNAKPL